MLVLKRVFSSVPGFLVTFSYKLVTFRIRVIKNGNCDNYSNKIYCSFYFCEVADCSFIHSGTFNRENIKNMKHVREPSCDL